MNLLESIVTFISENGLGIFNTILISVTILLSYQSFKFQTRTGIRESLEQLEDIEFSKEKLKPVLHEFVFKPFRGHRTTVQLKYYRYSTKPASASQNRDDLFHRTFYSINRDADTEIPEEKFREAIGAKLSTLDEVANVRLEDTGIFLEYDTGNAVEVRRRTEIVLKTLSNWHTTSDERFVETFDIEVEE